MNKEMLEAMKNRRSIRSYRKDLMIQEDVLQEILKTATYAPTGGGRQSPVIIAIKDKEMRDHISKLNAQIMGDKDADPFYGAPVIALVLADGSRSTWVEDGTNVLCYLMLAAKACGVSSVWVHREKEIFESEEGKKLMFKRDNEAEGTFGDLKENMGYDRLYRRGHDNVQMEIYLVAMGHNIRKYQKLKKRIKETEEKQMKRVREVLRLFIC